MTATSIFAGKRVLHLIGDSAWGGDTLYLFALAERMRDYGGEVYVGTTAPETIHVARQKGLPVIEIPSLRRAIHPKHDLMALWQVFRACRRYRFDLVHTHTAKPGFIGRIAARLAGTPCVVHTIQGFGFHNYSGRRERLFYSNLEWLAGHFCDLAISVNREDRATALDMRLIKPSKIVTVTNGVDTSRFQAPFDRAAFRRSLGLAEDEVLVGSIGRMWPQKDPQTFIEAARLIADQRPKVRCLFLGDGPLLDEMRGLAARLGLGDRLLLPGFQRNVADYLRALDIFVLNSLWEGMPLALLEAMCVGVPAIVTDIKGNRECVDSSCALIVNPQSPVEIKDSVLKLLDEPGLAASLAARAGQRFEEEFTEERMLRDTFTLYEKLLLKKGLRSHPAAAVSAVQ
jgi:glycosyltransferase involved in cell wall biosynthesis